MPARFPRARVRCQLESRELGIGTLELARRPQPARSMARQSVEREEKSVAEKQRLMSVGLK